jgi:hypothetical protein
LYRHLLLGVVSSSEDVLFLLFLPRFRPSKYILGHCYRCSSPARTKPASWPSLCRQCPSPPPPVFEIHHHHRHEPRPGSSSAARPRFTWMELTLARSSSAGAQFTGVDLDSTGGSSICHPQAPPLRPKHLPSPPLSISMAGATLAQSAARFASPGLNP